MMQEQAMMGGCQCGQVRYSITSEPVEVYVCHCSECRKQSSTAFGISMIVEASSFNLLSGNIKTYVRPATVAGEMSCQFCDTCGSRIWHGDLENGKYISVKGGSLDNPPDLSNSKHIWVSSKVPGVLIPEDAEVHQTEPPTSALSVDN